MSVLSWKRSLCAVVIPQGKKNARSERDRIHLPALTRNFIGLVGGDSAAHREDVCSVRLEVADQSLGHKGDLLCNSSKTDLVLDMK